jgi:hypothetical protein
MNPNSIQLLVIGYQRPTTRGRLSGFTDYCSLITDHLSFNDDLSAKDGVKPYPDKAKAKELKREPTKNRTKGKT